MRTPACKAPRHSATRQCRVHSRPHVVTIPPSLARSRSSPAAAHATASEQAPSLSRRALLATGTILSSSGLWLPQQGPNAHAAPAMETAQLGGDVTISRIIKGCWQLSGGHRGDQSTDRTQGRAAVEDFSVFYDNGITTFDTADHYGPSELLIGRWLKQKSEETGQDVRQKVQVLTKVCVFDSVSMATVNQGSMREAVDTSVRRLGTTPDLVQFYWGSYDIPRYVDAAKYLAEEQARGRFKLLGVTNFDVRTMKQMTDAGVKLASNQLQYSLLDRRPENGMAAFCQSQDIKLLPYGVLAGGLLSDKYLGLPVSSVVLDTYSKRKYASVLQQAGGWDWFQRLLGALRTVADKHNTSISNVATRWVLDRPGVAGTIVGARNAAHVPDHVAVSALRLDADDLASIQSVLDQGTRPRGDCYAWERGLGPF